MKLIISLFLCVLTGSTYAQYEQRSSLGMSGSSSSITIGDSAYYISSSVGQQSVIGTIGNNTYTMRQGFQQPPIRVMAIPDSNSTIEAVVYPNPVDDFVTIVFGSLVENDIVSTLYDIQGRVITTNIIAPTRSFQVDMSHLASGTYILKILITSEDFSTRLIKN
jgi:Secretion system C-terminal sorting domain